MSIEAMKMALEALEWNYGTDLENIENCTKWLDYLNKIIPALHQAIEYAENEEKIYTRQDVIDVVDAVSGALNRKWVGLTYEEIEELSLNKEAALFGFARAVEQKLKEKNGG